MSPSVIAPVTATRPAINTPNQTHGGFKKQIPAKSFLIARVRDSVSVNLITESKINNLFGLNKDIEDPVVQQLKKHSEKLVKKIFRDERNRDKTRELLDQPEEEKVFQNIHAPEKCYPAILRLNGVSGLDRVSEEGASNNMDLFNARKKNKIVPSSTHSKPKILFLRAKLQVHVSFYRDDFTLVRLRLRCKTTQDRYLDAGSHSIRELCSRSR